MEESNVNFENNVNNLSADFFERSFREVDGGYYDGKGFYCTPEGSFWDENKTYFNREGRDRHGGFYDEYCIYIPGPGWVEELGCYQDEISPEIQNEEVRENFFNNIKEELIEEYNDNEKYFMNFDKENFDEVDEESACRNEEEMFHEYMQKHFPQDNSLHSNTINSLNGGFNGFNGLPENSNHNIQNFQNPKIFNQHY